jgi:hypothetical protein
MGRCWTSSRFGFAVILAGCAPAPEASPRLHLDLADGLVACGGQHAHLQAFTFAAFEHLDQPVPDDLDLTLHVVGQDELEEIDVCADDAGGCAFDGEAWSTGGVDHHELVHVVLRELAPPAIAAFTEGIAEALGTPSPYWPPSTPRLPLTSYAAKTSVAIQESGELVSAGFLSTFLLDEFGPQVYLDLYRSLPRDSTVEDVDARMREHLGASLDELDERFVDPSEARCMVALAHCGDLYGPVMEPPFELEQSLSCEEEGVLGYAAEDGSRHPFRRWHLLIPRDGSYWVEAEGAIFSGIRCGACDERGTQYFNGSALMEGQVLEVEAGLYAFEVNEIFEGHDTFRLAIREAE